MPPCRSCRVQGDLSNRLTLRCKGVPKMLGRRDAHSRPIRYGLTTHSPGCTCKTVNQFTSPSRRTHLTSCSCPPVAWSSADGSARWSYTRGTDIPHTLLIPIPQRPFFPFRLFVPTKSFYLIIPFSFPDLPFFEDSLPSAAGPRGPSLGSPIDRHREHPLN